MKRWIRVSFFILITFCLLSWGSCVSQAKPETEEVSSTEGEPIMETESLTEKKEEKKVMAETLGENSVLAVIEAEHFIKEENGNAGKMRGRPATSGDTCITHWNYAGHALEWLVEIPQDGEYKILLRYASGRGWTVYRELKIDEEIPHPAFSKIALFTTGGWGRKETEWLDVIISDENKNPVLVKLTKGTHILRMTNLGGDGTDGAGNLDLIAFLDKWEPNVADGTLLFPFVTATEAPVILPPPIENPGVDLDIGSPVGFAAANNGTTGGTGGLVYKAEDAETFRNLVDGKDPRIILVSGTITLNERESLPVGSNKTIFGLEDARITKGGLTIENQSNIIIYNIVFEDAHDPNPTFPETEAASDNVHVGVGSSNIWVDHCSFSDGQHIDNESRNHDGCLDISGGSFITVSYCYFTNHDKVNIIGSSDERIENRGQLKTTFHHNMWDGTVQRHPRVRFGEVHLFNNYYKDIKLYAIRAGVEAQILSESNYFENVPDCWTFLDKPDMPGFVKDVDSVFVNSKKSKDSSEGFTFDPGKYYDYTLDPANKVKELVLSSVGAAGPITEPLTPENIAKLVKDFVNKKDGEVVFSDSFEAGVVRRYPREWSIMDREIHGPANTGPRLVDNETISIPHGEQAVKMINNPEADTKMNMEFTALSRGRVYAKVSVPASHPGFLSIELRTGGTRLFSFEFHPENKLRYRDENGQNRDTGKQYRHDVWYQLVLEWDIDAFVWQARIGETGDKPLVITPVNGVSMLKDVRGKGVPGKIELRLNKNTETTHGFLDDVKVCALE